MFRGKHIKDDCFREHQLINIEISQKKLINAY